MLDGRSVGQCGPPIGHHSVDVIGMDCAAPPGTHTLFSGESRVVQPTLAYEIDRSVWQSGSHIGGDRLNERAKLPLAESNLLFCPFCPSNVHDRAGKFEAVACILQRPCQNMEMLHAAVGKEQAMCRIKCHSSSRCPLYRLKHRSTILRVNPFYDPVK